MVRSFPIDGRKHYGINQKTLAKWKKRTSVADLATGPKSRARWFSLRIRRRSLPHSADTRCFPADAASHKVLQRRSPALWDGMNRTRVHVASNFFHHAGHGHMPRPTFEVVGFPIAQKPSGSRASGTFW